MGRGVNQAYSLLSTTHGHITDCKLDSVVYAGVCMWVNVDLSWLDRKIYARPILGAKPLIQFRHRWTEMNHSDHLYWLRPCPVGYTDSEPPSQLPNSLMPSAKLRSANLPVFTSLVYAVGDWTPASRTLSGRSNHCATQGRSQRVSHVLLAEFLTALR